MTRYFLFAGEASGDLHGSHLMRALYAIDKNAVLYGVGGPRMRQEGLECMLAMENFQVMGFSDVLCSLPKLCKLFYQTRDTILNLQPDCVVLIDYPGFNLRLARALRKQGFKGKLVQYICPTVWAHGRNRIHLLASYFDLLLTIFPFEAAYFSHTSLQVKYVGNPLVETIDTHVYQPDWTAQIGLPSSQPFIALFPGSRQGETRRHVPQQLQAAAQLKRRHPHLLFALSCAQESLKEELVHLIQQSPFRLHEDLYLVPPHYHYELMRSCHTALAKSGTVTLELALHATPTVVHYELSTLNYLIAKYLLRLSLPHYCMVNILGREEIFPELIGCKRSPTELSEQLESLHFHTSRRQLIKEKCEIIKRQLGQEKSHWYAAQAIRELLT